LSLDDTFKKVEHLLESVVKSVPREKKFQFLYEMNERLEGLIASNLDRMKMGHKSAPYPGWLFKQTIGKTKDGTKITTTVRPDTVYLSYLDHFGRPNIIPREVDDEHKWGWVSNPYFLSYEDLEPMMEEMKKYEVKFDISGESNYLPGRTFQIRFRNRESKDK
jgi:hypothetical protein